MERIYRVYACNWRIITINIFVILLSYLRFRIYRLSLTKTQDILFSFLDNAFEIFRCVPSEILTDNMKTVMDEARTKFKKGKVNTNFEQFAKEYGFTVKPCIADRPQTKAKVEAPMKILDEIRSYNGTIGYNELHELIENINNKVNNQVNQGTSKIPMMYFQKKVFLNSLPNAQIRKPYQINVNSSKINQSIMINYKGVNTPYHQNILVNN